MTKDEAYYRERMASFQIPEGCRDGLVLYLLHGIPPGHFLTAVLANDLHESIRRADSENSARLANYVQFLSACAPATAWGTLSQVASWIEEKYAERHHQG